MIIDQVLSHTSDRHPWFLESRGVATNAKADWYVWADPRPDGTPPNNWLAVFGGPAWQWEARRRQYYLHNFLREQPDLNFHNPEVQDGGARCHALLARAGRRRLPARHRATSTPTTRELRDNPPVDRGPAERRLPVNPYGHAAATSTLATAPRTSPSSSGCGR